MIRGMSAGPLEPQVSTVNLSYVIHRGRGTDSNFVALASNAHAAAVRVQAGRDVVGEAGGWYTITELHDGEPRRVVTILDTDREWSPSLPLFPLEASAA